MVRTIKVLLLVTVCAWWPLFVIAQTPSLDSLMAVRSQLKGYERLMADREIARLYIPINLDSTERYLSKLREYYDKTHDETIRAHILKIEANIAQANRNYEESMIKMREAYEIFKDLNNFKEMGWTARSLGIAYFYLGNYDDAMESYLKALAAFKEADDQLGIADTQNNLGAVCYMSGHPDKALEYYLRALQMFENQNLKSKKALTYNNIGILYFEREDYEEALEYFFQAADQMSEFNDISRLAGAYSNIAICYLKLDQFNTALHYNRRAIALAKQSNNSYTEISARLNLGVIHSGMHHPDSALFYLNKVLLEADTLGLKQIEEEAYKELANHYSMYGNYQQAFEADQQFIAIHDEIRNENSQKRMENLMTGYEQKMRQEELVRLREDRKTQSLVNKIFILMIALAFVLLVILIYGYSTKRKSNRMLEEKNEEFRTLNERLKESEASLKSLVEDNNKLFSIVAHDLRNPISAVSGFSELLFDNFDHLDDPTRKDYLKQIIEGASRTHDLLENLLLWARSQMNAVKISRRNIEIQRLIQEATLSVKVAMDHKRINLETNIEDNFTLNVDPEMIKAVVRNLLTNAAKFSYPEGKVMLRCFVSGDMGCIEVRDQGIGIRPEVMEKLFSAAVKTTTPGTSGESGSGLGLLICKDYTEKNGGTISIESQPARGSKFTICLPQAATA